MARMKKLWRENSGLFRAIVDIGHGCEIEMQQIISSPLRIEHPDPEDLVVEDYLNNNSSTIKTSNGELIPQPLYDKIMEISRND